MEMLVALTPFLCIKCNIKRVYQCYLFTVCRHTIMSIAKKYKYVGMILALLPLLLLGCATVINASPGRPPRSPHPAPSASLITDPNAVFTVPSVPKSGYLSPITDPVFNTTIIRIVGDANTTINFSQGGTGTWGGDARQHYQSDQAWNSDGTLLALENSVLRARSFLTATRTSRNTRNARTTV